METRNLGKLYDLPTLDWAPIAARLEKGYTQAPGTGGPDRHSTWLATINPDGSPHVTGIGSMFVDGTFWFETAETSRKGRNLARDPRCSLSVATQEFDLVVEGEAQKITDPATVADICERYNAHGWPCRVDDSGQALTAEYSAPSAGPPPWHVYRVTPRAATVLQVVEPSGATHWRF
jgi:PPOX class probable F420-dependent enzyme